MCSFYFLLIYGVLCVFFINLIFISVAKSTGINVNTYISAGSIDHIVGTARFPLASLPYKMIATKAVDGAGATAIYFPTMGKMLKTLRKDVACGCPIKGESPAKLCAAGSLTATRVRTAHRNLGPWHCTCATPRRLSTAHIGH
jgi:hypothetical protein